MLYTAQKLSAYFGPWKNNAQVAGGIIGLVLVLWGLRLIALRLAPRSGKRVGRFNRNRVMLPREGAVYLVIMIVAFVGSLVGRNNMLMLVFSIMAGPFIINGWITFTLLKRNIISRTVPPRVMAGEVFSVGITLSNRKFWFSSWMMVVRDRLVRERRKRLLGSDEHVLEPSVLFASVRPRQERQAHYQLHLNRRGRYRFGPLETSTRFPIGLVERGIVSDVTDELNVYPQIGRLSARWHDNTRMSAELVQRLQTRQGAFEDEFHHLRDYRAGDNPRDIHWRTSARRNGLMVRQYQQNRDRGLIVLLELWHPARPRKIDVDRIELAVSFAATICVDHLRQTRGMNQLLLVAGETSTSWVATTGGHALDSLLDTLTLVHGGSEPGFGELLGQARQSSTSTTRVLLITTRPADQMTDHPVPDELPGVGVFHATPQDLAPWFLLGEVVQLNPLSENAVNSETMSASEAFEDLESGDRDEDNDSVEHEPAPGMKPSSVAGVTEDGA